MLTSEPVSTNVPQKRSLPQHYNQTEDGGTPRKEKSRRAIEEAKRPTCDHCQKSFSNKYALRRHQEQHDSDRTRLDCPEAGCPETFSRQDVLDRHIKNKHEDGKVMCDGCENYFRKDYLHEHLHATGNRLCLDAYGIGAKKQERGLPATPEALGLVTKFTGLEVLRPPSSLPMLPVTTTTASSSRPLENRFGVGEIDIEMVNDGFGHRPPDDSSALAGDGCEGSILAIQPCDVDLSPTIETHWDEAHEGAQTYCQHGKTCVEMQQEAVYHRKESLSSVQLSIRRYLNKGPYARLRAPKPGTACQLCGVLLPPNEIAIIQHAIGHLRTPPDPNHQCEGCGVAFVYEADLAAHRARSRRHRLSPWAGTVGIVYIELAWRDECRDVRLDGDHNWVSRCFQADFLSQLRCWEKLQLLQYLDHVYGYYGARVAAECDVSDQVSQYCHSEAALCTRVCGVRKPFGSESSPPTEHRLVAEDIGQALASLSLNFKEAVSSPLLSRTAKARCTVSLSPLAQAFAASKTEDVLALIKRGRRHTCASCKRYVFRWACASGKVKVASALIEAGIHPDTHDESSKGPADSNASTGRPILVAMLRDHLHIVALLLKHGASLAGIEHQVVHYILGTSKDGALDCLSLLLSGEHAASPEQLAYRRRLCLKQSTERRNVAATNMLIQCSSFEDPDHSLLMVACRWGEPSTIALLLDHNNASVTARNDEGKTPLHLLCEYIHSDAAMALLNSFARHECTLLDAQDLEGTTPLMIASGWCCSVDMVGLLLRYGANVNLTDRYGRTALHHACQKTLHERSGPVVFQLIRAGADVNTMSENGSTALGISVRTKKYALVRPLLAAGARLDTKKDEKLKELWAARHDENLIEPMTATLLEAAVKRRGWHIFG